MDNNEAGKARIYAICAAALGAALAFTPYSFIRITAYAAGGMLIILGGATLFPAMQHEKRAFTVRTAVSAASIVIGIGALISPYWFIDALPSISGSAVVIYSTGKMKEISGDTIDTVDWKKAWPYAACAAFGFILLLGPPFSTAAAGVKASGAAVILSGILGILHHS